MKRLYILFLISHFSFLISYAQVGEYRTDLAVGFNAGYMMSSVGFVPEVPQKNLGGLTGGLTVRYTCERYFKSICAIVAEVNLAQTGWKENITDIDSQPVYYLDDETKSNPLAYERKMTYVQVPLMARLGWGRERKGLQAFIQAGPQMGFFMSESTKTNVVNGKQTQTDRSSKVVAQDTMAVEFSHPKVGHFIVEGRYYYGLGDIYKNSKSDYFSRSNFGQIVIKATYLFDIIKTKNPKIK